MLLEGKTLAATIRQSLPERAEAVRQKMGRALTLYAYGNADDYAKKTDISGLYKYKGSKETFSALPTSGNVTGDVWNVEDTGMNYAWTGEGWDALGATFEISSITNGEIDTITSDTAET